MILCQWWLWHNSESGAHTIDFDRTQAAHQKEHPVGNLELRAAAHDGPVRPEEIVTADEVRKRVPPVAPAPRQVGPDVSGILVHAGDDGVCGVAGRVRPGLAPAPVEVDEGQDAVLRANGVKLGFEKAGYSLFSIY